MPKLNDYECFLKIHIRLQRNQFCHLDEALEQHHEGHPQQILGCRKHVRLQIFRLHVLGEDKAQKMQFFQS